MHKSTAPPLPCTSAPLRIRLRTKLISWLGFMLVSIIGRTLRIKDKGDTTNRCDLKSRVIYAFWHSDFFPLIYAHRFQKIVVLVSPHQDGEYLSRVISRLGYLPVRGASSDDGAKGAIRLLKIKASPFAIAPDGPTGPREKVKDGVLKLAELTRLQVIPVGVGIKNFIRLGSWDRFKLPIPFSRCVIYWGAPIWVDKTNEAMRRKLESALISANQMAQSLL